MVKSKSNSRLSSLESVVLTQTDTTVGFLSQNATKLYEIKSRKTSKEFICVYPNFKELLLSNNRIPSTQKKFIRRSKKTTFIVNNKAFRIVKSSLHSQILRDLKWTYSTSANESGKSFAFDFCEDKADIIIQNKYGLQENMPSSLLKINRVKKVRLR